MLISICCLTYNHEPYIRQCLDGFLMQKTNFAFEILIHDDASTDNTAEIIQEYEKKYPDIIKPIYQKENQYSKGKPISVTYQFPRAEGKYIAMCEGDDYWIDPYKLQKQVDFLESNRDYNISAHNAIRLENSNGIYALFNRMPLKKTFTIQDLIMEGWFIPTASIVFRKESLINNPMKELFFNGDYYLQLLLLTPLNSYGHYIDQVMSIYRIHENGISNIQHGRGSNEKDLISLLQYVDQYSDRQYTDLFSERISIMQKEYVQRQQRIKHRNTFLFKLIRKIYFYLHKYLHKYS